MNPVVLSFPNNEELGKKIVEVLSGEKGEFVQRSFPDGETYMRILSDVKNRDVVIVCTLERPNDKLLPLCFLAGAAKENGARSVGFVAPYLAYMRQDHQFAVGECVSSQYFARIINGFFDWLITVDPHLHRYPTLEKIYTIPTRVVHASALLARYIRATVPNPVIIGPDIESRQWVDEVAREAHARSIVFQKERYSDTKVKITLPEALDLQTATPVLIDDIISTGHTMVETATVLLQHGFKAPICIGIHGIFAGNCYDEMMKSGLSEIITSNTIHHVTNKIDVSELILQAICDVEFLRYDNQVYLKNIQLIIERELK